MYFPYEILCVVLPVALSFSRFRIMGLVANMNHIMMNG